MTKQTVNISVNQIRTRRFYSHAFKASVVREYLAGTPAAHLEARHGLFTGAVGQWRNALALPDAQTSEPQAQPSVSLPIIELEIKGVVARLAAGVKPDAIEAVIRALRSAA